MQVDNPIWHQRMSEVACPPATAAPPIPGRRQGHGSRWTTAALVNDVTWQDALTMQQQAQSDFEMKRRMTGLAAFATHWQRTTDRRRVANLKSGRSMRKVQSPRRPQAEGIKLPPATFAVPHASSSSSDDELAATVLDDGVSRVAPVAVPRFREGDVARWKRAAADVIDHGAEAAGGVVGGIASLTARGAHHAADFDDDLALFGDLEPKDTPVVRNACASPRTAVPPSGSPKGASGSLRTVVLRSGSPRAAAGSASPRAAAAGSSSPDAMRHDHASSFSLSRTAVLMRNQQGGRTGVSGGAATFQLDTAAEGVERQCRRARETKELLYDETRELPCDEAKQLRPCNDVASSAAEDVVADTLPPEPKEPVEVTDSGVAIDSTVPPTNNSTVPTTPPIADDTGNTAIPPNMDADRGKPPLFPPPLPQLRPSGSAYSRSSYRRDGRPAQRMARVGGRPAAAQSTPASPVRPPSSASSIASSTTAASSYSLASAATWSRSLKQQLDAVLSRVTTVLQLTQSAATSDQTTARKEESVSVRSAVVQLVVESGERPSSSSGPRPPSGQSSRSLSAFRRRSPPVPATEAVTTNRDLTVNTATSHPHHDMPLPRYAVLHSLADVTLSVYEDLPDALRLRYLILGGSGSADSSSASNSFAPGDATSALGKSATPLIAPVVAYVRDDTAKGGIIALRQALLIGHDDDRGCQRSHHTVPRFAHGTMPHASVKSRAVAQPSDLIVPVERQDDLFAMPLAKLPSRTVSCHRPLVDPHPSRQACLDDELISMYAALELGAAATTAPVDHQAAE